MSNEPAKMVMLSVQIPAEMADAMRDRAKDTERTLSAEVRVALRAYLKSPAEAAA